MWSQRPWCHVSWGWGGVGAEWAEGAAARWPGAAGLKGSVGRRSARQPASETETGSEPDAQKDAFYLFVLTCVLPLQGSQPCGDPKPNTPVFP